MSTELAMRICPQCNAAYQGDEIVCPKDGTTLEVTSPPGKPASAFATTALGAGDVRDTPFTPPPLDAIQIPEGEDYFLGKIFNGLYQIESKLGEGGMGAVYVARHVHMDKRFAVKVLSRSIAKNRSAVERLKQEAIAAGKIDHDNIVDIKNFDVTPDGDVFIVMELLKGQSLADVIVQGPLQLDRALQIGWQLASALGAAHEHEIVHRDLKPENVFILKKGNADFVKVLDFGISKMRTAEAEQVRMTKTGQLVGTPLYMSPEQAKGEMEVDHRCDIYALGVILYEMLTGAPPFSGTNYFQLLWAHGNEPPQSMRLRNPNVYIPETVDAVVLRALAKRRDDRWQTMAELGDALAEAAPDIPRTSLPSHPTPVPSLRPDSSQRLAIGGQAVSTLAPGTERPIQGRAMRRGVVWAGVALVAVALGVTAIGMATGEREPDTRVVLDTAPRPVTDPAPRPDPAPDPHPAIGPRDPTPQGDPDATADVHFESRPPGARVFVGGDVVCEHTPCDATIARADRPLSVRFSLARYRDSTRTFTPGLDEQVSADLRPVRIREPGGGPSTGIKGWND